MLGGVNPQTHTTHKWVWQGEKKQEKIKQKQK